MDGDLGFGLTLLFAALIPPDHLALTMVWIKYILYVRLASFRALEVLCVGAKDGGVKNSSKRTR